MKPSFKRPGSAKSGSTKITHDSDDLSKDLHASKLSETFTGGVKKTEQKNDDFHEYVANKNKDPKFKKYQQNNLPKIPEVPQKVEKSSAASKPFQKKTRKVFEEKKVEVELQEDTNLNNSIKSQDSNYNTNPITFLDKSKKKMNGLKVKQEQPQSNKKIEFKGFTVKQLGKKSKAPNKQSPIKNSPQAKKQQKNEKRRREQSQIEKFIEETEEKNMQYYPQHYQNFIASSHGEDLQKINLNDYSMNDLTERDYLEVMKNIKTFDKKIKKEQQQSCHSQNSINLDELIESSQNASEIALSSMSASDLQQRNLFVTEILKGRISKEQIQQLQELQKRSIKFNKLEESDHDSEEEDSLQSQIIMKKKISNRITQRNKMEAAGKVYKQCDTLSEEEKKRLDQLLNGTLQISPYEHSQMEQLKQQRLDEGITMYREVSDRAFQEGPVLPDEILPKDPMLRKQAELKILKEKAARVNERITKLNNQSVNRKEIEKAIEKYKERTKLTKISSQLLQEKEKQFNEQSSKIEEALKIIEEYDRVEKREQMEISLQKMNEKFKQLESQIEQIQQMDSEQLQLLEIQHLKEKKESVYKLNEFTSVIDKEIQLFEMDAEQIREKIRTLDQILSIKIEPLNYENHDPNETIEDIDKIITQRWEEAERITEQLRNSTPDTSQS